MTTAIVLNWNTLNVSKDSIRRLKREVPVIVVDNGSTDGSREYFETHPDPNVTYILLDENVGNCKSRNLAIEAAESDFVFFLDGDILYVPDSIKYLEEILENHPECGICGVHNENNVRKYGFNGVPTPTMADLKASRPDKVYRGFPMAWTQYGLFRNTGQRFIETPPFDTAGMGYEDSWYYHEMKEKGLESYFITQPNYYHDAHAGFRELEKAKLPHREEERKDAFHRRFGKVDWLDCNFTIEEV